MQYIYLINFNFLKKLTTCTSTDCSGQFCLFRPAGSLTQRKVGAFPDATTTHHKMTTNFRMIHRDCGLLFLTILVLTHATTTIVTPSAAAGCALADGTLHSPMDMAQVYSLSQFVAHFQFVSTVAVVEADLRKKNHQCFYFPGH